MLIPLTHSAALPLLATIEESVNYVLGLASLTIALAAIYLAIHHSRAISDVQDEIQKAQAQTRDNLTATTKVGDQTLAALDLHGFLVKNEKLSDSINNLAADFAQVVDLDDPLLSRRADQDVTQARNYIHMAAEGHLTIGPEALAADEEIPSALLEFTKKGDEFWASSVVDPAFWARASAYLQLQKDRIDAEVKIKRVFIFKDKAAFEDEHAQQQLLLQIEKGITVHAVVEPRHTPRDLVALARPVTTPTTDDAEPELGAPKPVPDVLYAAEFGVADGRVTGIELWSSSAGHKPRVTRIWNTLKGFYDNSDVVKAEDLSVTSTHLSHADLSEMGAK